MKKELLTQKENEVFDIIEKSNTSRVSLAWLSEKMGTTRERCRVLLKGLAAKGYVVLKKDNRLPYHSRQIVEIAK